MPARLSQINMGLEPRVQMDVAGRSRNFFVDIGATYCVVAFSSGAFSSGAFSPQTCTIFGATERTTKMFT